jgi:hypothetical protein
MAADKNTPGIKPGTHRSDPATTVGPKPVEKPADADPVVVIANDADDDQAKAMADLHESVKSLTAQAEAARREADERAHRLEAEIDRLKRQPIPQPPPPAPAPIAPSGTAKPCRFASEVLDKLKASGTGEAKLAAIRSAMKAHFDADRHAHMLADDPHRHLSAAGAVRALHEAGFGELTIRKAQCIAERGEYIPAVVGAVETRDDTPMPPPAAK